ncbi:hypothetical protein I9Y31_002522 [Clostridium perfringens]|nr:hypothetical protein [Clostridium perfringens]MDU7068939.1 hypothetical protein [Clostridium perfringens]
MVENFKKIENKEIYLKEVIDRYVVNSEIIKRKVDSMMYGYSFEDNNERFLVTLEKGKHLFNYYEHLDITIYDLKRGLDVSYLNAEFLIEGEIRISAIDTMNAYWGRNYATIITQLLINYAKNNKFSKIYGGIFLGGDTEALKRFYKRNGFEVKSSYFSMNL